MSTQLASRLGHARRRSFVGRNVELELFRTALSADASDFAVLHLHGPGGVGKSTLLREFARLAEMENRTPLLLDCRHLDPSPAGFIAALQRALQLPFEQAPLAALETAPHVLLIDTFELAAPLDSWLREEFLPQLPMHTFVVIAGRQPPTAAWRDDDGWRELTRIVSLRNLPPEESTTLLRNHGMSAPDIARILSVTYGHPLALALAADLFTQNRVTAHFDLKQSPDTVRLLLERFVADVPNPILRQALEVCAHTFNTDEALLAHCLGEEHSYAAFQWLRDLSFIEHGPFGLFPHDLAREVLEVDLRWRNLNRFREVHFQVRNYIIQQIQARRGLAQQQAIFALLFLHRNNPFMRPFYEWQSFGQIYIDVAQAADFAHIERMILHHQGQESLALARYWRDQPHATFYVFRAAGGFIAGYCHVIEIRQFSAADLTADPALRAASAYLQTTSPRRTDGSIYYFRNWMDAAHYQNSPSIFNTCATIALRIYFNVQDLTHTFIAQAANEAYDGMYEYLRQPRIPQAGFNLDNQAFSVYGHDWSTEPVLEWINIMGERELLDEIIELEKIALPQQPVVLSEPEFAEAVRQALKDVRRPDLLQHSPLLRSRCVSDFAEQTAATPTPATLQALLRAGSDALTVTPRTQKLQRALWHTYFEPAPTQELAAELLGLPFSTYRYQLAKGIDQLVYWLWQREVYGVDSADPG